MIVWMILQDIDFDMQLETDLQKKNLKLSITRVCIILGIIIVLPNHIHL